MAELSMGKRLGVVRFYFEGLSYEEIARRAGVAKGSVVNVLNELKAGQFPQVRNLEDGLETLRELAVGLKRSHLSPSQAALGLGAFRGLESLGVGPGELERVVALYRQLAPEGMDTGNFVRASLALNQLQDRTGRNPEELMVWLEELEASAGELVQRCQEMVPLTQEVADLQHQRDRLVQEQTALTSQIQDVEAQVDDHRERLQWLQGEVSKTEQLIGELGRRFLQREGEAQEAEHRLTQAREGLEQMAGLGLPIARLPEIAARVASAAHHQRIDPEQFLQWFFSCIQGASSLLGLDTLIKAKQEELQEGERALASARKELDRCAAQVRELKRQRTAEEAVKGRLRKAWQEEIINVGATLKEAAGHEVVELRALGASLRQEVLRSHEECRVTAFAMGRLEEAIDSYGMVKSLVDLLQGRDGLAPGEVRVVATALCLGLMGHMEREGGGNWQADIVGSRVKALLEALERWKV